MKNIIEQTKKLKSRVLAILENKINENLSIAEINTLLDCIDKITDEKNLYNLKLIEVLENLHKANAGFSGISLPSE